MAGPDLSEEQRQKLLALLSDDALDSTDFIARLRSIQRADGVSACSEALRLLANLQFPERRAREILEKVSGHRDALTKTLGRDPGLHVAAVDFLSNLETHLREPMVIEASQYRQIERSAVTDPLTGLHNRRYFRSAFTRELRRTKRYGLTCSLLLFDLDYFKAVNDHFGHMLGDLALKRVARVFKTTLRDPDVACRYGGEEFAAICPETTRLGAYSVAERIRRAVAAAFRARPIGGREIDLTISAGLATYPDDGPDAPAMLSRADETLYQAKHSGRNQVVAFPGDRRRSLRYPARPGAKVKLRIGGAARTAEGVGINFSRDGALVLSEATGRRADPVQLELSGRHRGGYAVDGSIVRVEPDRERTGASRFGIAFEQRLPVDQLMARVDVRSGSRVAGGSGA